MSLGLVAYGSSDEGEDSDIEEPVLKKAKQEELKSGDSDSQVETRHSEKSVINDTLNLESNPPISDDEDDYIPVSIDSVGSGGGGVLNLPPPKFVATETTFENQTEETGQNALVLSLPKPKAENYTGIEEDELEDFVKAKPNELGKAEDNPPVKKKKIVQITVPALQGDSDDDEDDSTSQRPEVTNKTKHKCGLFDVLPAPKNITGSKELGKKIIPLSTSKPIEGENNDFVANPKKSVQHTNSVSGVLPSAKLKSNMFIPASLTRKTQQTSTSAFNLETGMMIPHKSKKLSVSKKENGAEKSNDHIGSADNGSKALVSGVPEDDESEDEESNSTNFFSIGEQNQEQDIIQSPETVMKDVSETSTKPESEPMTFSETASQELQDAPLQFKNTASSSYGNSLNYRFRNPQEGSNIYSSSQQYNMAYAEDQEGKEPSSSSQYEEMAEHQSDFMQDKEFLKMQGKSKRGKEEINFIDVHQEDQMSHVNVALKNLTEETNMMSHSKKKNKDMPSSQQKRKHQITYLAFKAKEAELELKNQWANNRSTKKQTQAKYGF